MAQGDHGHDRGHQPVNAGGSASVQNIRDRGALYFQLFFAEMRDRVLASGHLDAKTLDAASALLDDPAYWNQCWMMTAASARKSIGGVRTSVAGTPGIDTLPGAVGAPHIAGAAAS
jgi:hypothetical protein